MLILCFPFKVSAESITKLEVLNGQLSRKFETNNNIYSITLKEGETIPNFSYTLKNEEDKVEIQNEEEKTMIEVTTENGLKETYTFYLNEEESTPVFHEYKKSLKKENKENPYLGYYIGAIVIIIILILFKFIVLGFKKEHKIKYEKLNRPSWFKK